MIFNTSLAHLKGVSPPARNCPHLCRTPSIHPGRLNHAIRMAAYYGASAEYKFRQSHTSKETEYAYLAWFEKRPKPVIFVVRLSEIDGSLLRFNMREGEPLGLARVLILPPLAFSFCLYWFRRKHASSGKKLLTNAQIGN